MGTLVTAGAALPLARSIASDGPIEPDPSASLYPVKRNPKYSVERPITDAKYSTNYNNFYEYGAEKDIAEAAQQLKIRPWTVTIDGMVEKPMTIAIDDLLKQMPLEERIYHKAGVSGTALNVIALFQKVQLRKIAKKRFTTMILSIKRRVRSARALHSQNLDRCFGLTTLIQSSNRFT
jgi:DMSO/TMAO reductase YedYZ molybdopterin-dependent catalytic subunit